MYSVTKRVEMIKQPRGGYLKVALFVRNEFDDGIILNKNENIDPSIIGIAVDYLTRYISGVPSNEAFGISLLGAKNLDIYKKTGVEEFQKASSYVSNIDGLTDESIISACKLAGYDVCYRSSCKEYRKDGLVPDEYAINNIRTMVNRSIRFFQKEGSIKKVNITFPNGYTEIISSGDADYMTPTGLWDIKVSKNNLNAQYTLQLLVYYLMGLKSDPDSFDKIVKIGFFNPRKNCCYWIDTSFIPDSVISVVSREVIGYKE